MDKITEGNRLICEYDGHKWIGEEHVADKYTERAILMDGWDMFVSEYHSSWDWLMPVIKKFDALTPTIIEDVYYQYSILCEEIDNAVTFYEIEPVFEVMVKAIKWYNENK